MVTLRKVALGLLVAASLAVLVVAVSIAWNHRESEYLPLYNPTYSDVDMRLRLLLERVEILDHRVADMELLVLLLLGASGVCSLVFALTSYFSAIALGRQADSTVANFKDQLKRLKDKTDTTEPRVVVNTPITPDAAGVEEHVAAIGARLAGLRANRLDDQGRLELQHYESAVAFLELTGDGEAATSIARLYRTFARFYNSRDKARFYLNRALALSPADSEFASEIHYDLSCWHAANRDFASATAELALAFRRPSKVLDDRIAQDIEEGGELFGLANTPPYDKALNDLLLNITVVS
jgi:hypothetical protein